MSDGYLLPARPGEAELREKGSRFLAWVEPVSDEEAARQALSAIRRRFPDATHHCWALRIGDPPRERSSDDGEPGGTAGAPILQALRSVPLSDALLVVVRWFGGTKLGKGGLVRAYGGAARMVLSEVPAREEFPTVRLSVTLPYDRIGGVKRLVNPPSVELSDESYGETVRLVFTVRRRDRASFEANLADLVLEAKECD